MATMVDRPQSALLSSPPTIPQRRPVTDIIDVDLLDSDDELETSRRVRSRREPSVEVIEVSEDEDEHVFPIAGRSGSGDSDMSAPTRTFPRNRNLNRLFSPPPRLDMTPTFIPPVPRLAPHLASHASLPMLRHPPPYPPHPPHSHQHIGGAGSSSSSLSTVQPPVRAHDRPFGFEGAFSSPRGSSSGSGRSRHPSPSTRPSGSRVSSRGSSPAGLPPRLGLGGALISSNNARVTEERQIASRRRLSATQRAREHAHARTLRAVARTNGHRGDWGLGFGGFGGGGGGFGNDRDQALAHLYLEIGLMPMEWPPGFLDPHQSKRAEVEYRTEYTHPQPVEAGFTFDFAAGSSEDGDGNLSEGSQFPATSAQNPIIIDDDDQEGKSSVGSSSNIESKGKGRATIVESSSPSPLSLRTLLVCSHCREPLLLGESASKLKPEGEKARRIWSLRCGHLIDGKCLEVLSIPSSTLSSFSEQAQASSLDAYEKGKGKAITSPETENASEPFDYRARLRSRRSYMPSLPSLSSLMAGRKNDVKKRETNDSNTIQETFTWECPVGGCSKQHTSVRIRDVWGPAKPEMGKGDGVIGVFV